MNAHKAQIVEIVGPDFKAEVLSPQQPVMAVFLSPWSRPCHIIRPVLDEVAAACAGRVKVVTINVDDYPDLGAWYEIQSIPTLLCFVDGRVRARIVGTASKEAILSKLQSVLEGGDSPSGTPGVKA